MDRPAVDADLPVTCTRRVEGRPDRRVEVDPGPDIQIPPDLAVDAPGVRHDHDGAREISAVEMDFWRSLTPARPGRRSSTSPGLQSPRESPHDTPRRVPWCGGCPPKLSTGRDSQGLKEGRAMRLRDGLAM